jgi:hypothetical protein
VKKNDKFCSDLSLGSAQPEPLLGSAHHVNGFILLTWPRGKWGPQHFKSRGLPESLVQELKRIQRTHRYFLRLISNGNSDDTGLRLYVMPENKCVQAESIMQVETLLHEAFGGDSPSRNALDSWPENNKRLILCCTNGARDRCCAKYGFAVFKEAQRIARNGKNNFQIFQSTHLTGDRFAACVLELPSGDLYGRVRADNVKLFFDSVSRNEIYFPLFRGNSYKGEIDQIIEGLVTHWQQSNLLTGRDWTIERASEVGRHILLIREKDSAGFASTIGKVEIGTQQFLLHTDCAAVDKNEIETISRKIIVKQDLPISDRN